MSQNVKKKILSILDTAYPEGSKGMFTLNENLASELKTVIEDTQKNPDHNINQELLVAILLARGGVEWAEAVANKIVKSLSLA